MNKDYTYLDAFKASRRAQNKFDYFFLGAILATLSLSIQTFSSTQLFVQNYLIIITWFSWLTSFLAGMYRQERLNIFLSVEAGYLRYQPKYNILLKAQMGEQILFKTPEEMWEPKEIQEELNQIKEIIDLSDELKKKNNRHAQYAYTLQKWLFVFGLITYVLFRIVNINPSLPIK